MQVYALARAAQILGGEAQLARQLGVSQWTLSFYRDSLERLPQALFLKLVDVLSAEEMRRLAEERLARNGKARSADEVLKANFERSKEVRAQLLKEAATLMRSDAASMQVLDVQKDELLLLDWNGFHPDSAAYWQRVPAGNESTCGAALKERQRVTVADVNDPTYGLTQEGIAHYKLSRLAAVQSTPLVSRDGHVLGMISTHWHRVHQPAERDLGRFDVLARKVADVLESART